MKYLALILASASLCASEIVDFGNISQEDLTSFTNGATILKVKKGETIGLGLNVNSELFSLNGSSQLSLVPNCDLYVKTDGELLVSIDGRAWHTYQDFVTGSLGVTLATQAPTLSIDLLLNKRH